MDSHLAGLIIWDVDGTLVPGDLRFLRRAVSRAYQLEEGAVVFGDFAGTTDYHIARQAAILSGIREEAAAAGLPRFGTKLAEVMEEAREELVREFAPYPGALRTIESLHEEGFHQTVLTGNLREAAEIKLQVLGLHHFLNLDLGAYGSDSERRLDLPAVVMRRFATALGQELDPSQTVLIGDTARDVACARHGGFRVIAVAHGFGSHEDLVKSAPDALVDRLDPVTVVETVRDLIRPRSSETPTPVG